MEQDSPRLIKSNTTRYINLNDLNGELVTDVIDVLSNMLNNIPEMCQANTTIDTDVGHYDAYFALKYPRPETDEEYNSRIAAIVLKNRTTEEKEKVELARLLEKYGTLY